MKKIYIISIGIAVLICLAVASLSYFDFNIVSLLPSEKINETDTVAPAPDSLLLGYENGNYSVSINGHRAYDVYYNPVARINPQYVGISVIWKMTEYGIAHSDSLVMPCKGVAYVYWGILVNTKNNTACIVYCEYLKKGEARDVVCEVREEWFPSNFSDLANYYVQTAKKLALSPRAKKVQEP